MTEILSTWKNMQRKNSILQKFYQNILSKIPQKHSKTEDPKTKNPKTKYPKIKYPNTYKNL